jgi:hypothetical protein
VRELAVGAFFLLDLFFLGRPSLFVPAAIVVVDKGETPVHLALLLGRTLLLLYLFTLPFFLRLDRQLPLPHQQYYIHAYSDLLY